VLLELVDVVAVVAVEDVVLVVPSVVGKSSEFVFVDEVEDVVVPEVSVVIVVDVDEVVVVVSVGAGGVIVAFSFLHSVNANMQKANIIDNIIVVFIISFYKDYRILYHYNL
jgi:hypothetical protein